MRQPKGRSAVSPTFGLLLAALALSTVACVRQGGFTIAVAPTRLAVIQNQSAKATVTLGAILGSTAEANAIYANLALEGAPAGASGTFAPAQAVLSINPASPNTTSELTVSVTNTPIGEYALRVRGVDNKQNVHEAALTLVVTAP